LSVLDLDEHPESRHELSDRVRQILEDVQEEVQRTASSAILALATQVAHKLADELRPLTDLRSDQVESLQKLESEVRRWYRRSPPKEEHFNDRDHRSLEIAWEPVAGSAVRALLDDLVARGRAVDVDAQAWADSTVSRLDTARFCRVSGLPDHDVPMVISRSAHAVTELGSQDGTALPQYYRDRWGDLSIDDGRVRFRPTVPAVIVSPAHAQDRWSTIEQLCSESAIIELLPLVPSTEQLEDRSLSVGLSVTPAQSVNVRVDLSGDVDGNALGRPLLSLPCEDIDIDDPDSFRWSWTGSGLLGEAYLAEDAGLNA
jgi:hypothetical protein